MASVVALSVLDEMVVVLVGVVLVLLVVAVGALVSVLLVVAVGALVSVLASALVVSMVLTIASLPCQCSPSPPASPSALVAASACRPKKNV